MRVKNIKISLEIPAPTDKPDGNGVLYTERAIEKACQNTGNLPIILYNSKGSTRVAGIAQNVRYENGHILVDGVLQYGGMEELVEFNDENAITSMEIVGFGID